MLNLKLIGLLLALLSVLGSCAYTGHVKRDRDQWKEKAQAAQQLSRLNKKRAEEWAESLTLCERNRRSEHAQAIASINSAQANCQDRVDQTKRSRDNLARLLASAPKRDAQGCAARDDLVMLRDLVR